MAKRTRFSEYENSYANYKFELTDDGILFMQCHTDGDSLVWSWQAHDDMSDAFADIAGDREIKVLIHTGTGANYNANWGRMPNGDPVETPVYQLMPDTRGLLKLDEKAWYARHLVFNVRRRRSDDQRRQRPVQHALRSPADGRHRAGVRGRLLPGRLALSPRSGSRRRPACHLELSRRPHQGALLPADRHETRCAGGQGVGGRQRGAAQGPIAGSRMGIGP